MHVYIIVNIMIKKNTKISITIKVSRDEYRSKSLKSRLILTNIYM